MKKTFKKLLFITGALIPITAFSITIVSCGHKDTDNNTWEEFQKMINKVAPVDIVNQVAPSAWSDNVSAVFTKGIPVADGYTVSLQVTRTKDGVAMIATFKIMYTKNLKYKINEWKLDQAPTYVGTWENFKAAALKVTAKELLDEARTSAVLNKLKWPVGTAEQTKWGIADQAEFDTYGYLDKDKDTFKGMAGKPVVDPVKHTVTAIISKINERGNYDSDPIKVVVSWSTTPVYKMGDWKFQETAQLQSQNKWNDLMVKEKALFINFYNFQKINWANFPNLDLSGNNRSKSIEQILIANDFPLPQDGNRGWDPHGFNYNTKITSGAAGVQAKVGYNFASDLSSSLNSYKSARAVYTMSLFSNFIYANGKDDSGGGTAFNYTWTIIMNV